jgi:zinc protease
MKKAKILKLVALAALLVPGLEAAEEKPLPRDLPPFGVDKPLPVPSIDQSALANGLRLWIVGRPGFPRVTAVLAVRGGTSADPEGMEGVGELLADTLKEGTATRSARAVAEELQAVGGEMTAEATDDAVLVTVDGLATGTATLLDVLADVARRPAFPAAEVELAKGNALQGLDAREATPEFLAQKAFARAVFGAHPYHIVAPSRETLRAAGPELLRKEHARRFRPEASLLVVVGDVDPEAVRKAVGRAFGAWKGAGVPPAPAPAAPPAPPRRLLAVHRPGSVQSLFLVGRPVPTASDPRYYPLVVANTVFGGTFGSRLVQNIREEKGYTYSPRAAVQAMEKTGLLSVRADVRNQVTGASLLEITYELDRMATTDPTDEELKRAKRYQSGLYLLRNQIQGAVARTLANNWVNGLPPEALGEFVTRVNAVTTADVRKAGGSYFTSSTQTVVVVGDEATIKEELAAFGTVTMVQP